MRPGTGSGHPSGHRVRWQAVGHGTGTGPGTGGPWRGTPAATGDHETGDHETGHRARWAPLAAAGMGDHGHRGHGSGGRVRRGKNSPVYSTRARPGILWASGWPPEFPEFRENSLHGRHEKCTVGMGTVPGARIAHIWASNRKRENANGSNNGKYTLMGYGIGHRTCGYRK